MMSNKFVTKTGWPTTYAMEQGRILCTDTATGQTIVLRWTFRTLRKLPPFLITVYDPKIKNAICEATGVHLEDGVAFSQYGSISFCRRLYRKFGGQLIQDYKN